MVTLFKMSRFPKWITFVSNVAGKLESSGIYRKKYLLILVVCAHELCGSLILYAFIKNISLALLLSIRSTGFLYPV